MEKEKSSRKSRGERNRDRDSVKARPDRDPDNNHRSRSDKVHRSRDADEDKHRSTRGRDGDNNRPRESSHVKDLNRERSHEPKIYEEDHRRSREYSQDRELKRERSHEPKNYEEDRRRSREYSQDRESKRERSHEPRSYEEDHRRSTEYSKDRELKRERFHEPHNHKEDDRRRREYSQDRELKVKEPKGEREAKQERVEREGSKDRHSSPSRKRKDREGGEDRLDGGRKRTRDSRDSGKEKDREGSEDRLDGGKKRTRDGRESGRVLDDRRGEHSGKKEANEEWLDNNQDTVKSNGNGSAENGPHLEPLNTTSRIVPETSLNSSQPPHTKVSSISTTNENKGVSITRSHEVHGKSSTDGTTSAAGKNAGLNLDALTKAKKALQLHKELAEKLKHTHALKGASSSSGGSQHVGLSDQHKAHTSSKGILQGSFPSSATIPASAAASMKPSTSSVPSLPGITTIPNYEAVIRAQELAAKMGFRQDPEFAPLINMFPGQLPTDVAIHPKPPKAPVLRLDALGREIDEHGNVVDKPKVTSLSTLKVNINKQKQDAFQILKPELNVDPESNPHFDPRMGIDKTKLLRPKRMTFQFVDEGKWSKDAEIIKLKSQFGEAQAKELRVKQAQLAKAKAEPDINPNLIEVSERVVIKEKQKDPIPEVEWWDVPLLLSGTYGDIGDDSITEDKLKLEKITIYVEHPRPIEPPAEPVPPPPQPLKLTKKEQKKLRTQRRLAREKDRQEMIRQGLIEPPKAKVKMSNLMKVLGSEATQDPTRLEMEIRSAAAEREQAHVDRNIARRLTPAERREKKERKLFDDPSNLETIVSVYKINDLSHPQTRFKVDVNAQENRLTGCAVISDEISVVVVEGGSKAIKRYGKLMLRRINWAADVEKEDEVEDDDDDEDGEKAANKCVLVWQGSVAKQSFSRFVVHQCRTESASRKVFTDAGVPHYWDLAVNFSDDQI